jgi:MoxR-like ATPase
MGRMPFSLVESLQEGLAREHYLADRGLSTAIFLAVSLDKPLLLEGEAGVGKTEVAKVLASLLDRELIRLQCYEGIDASQALYEWNYSKQLIAVRAMQDVTAEANVEDLFGPEYLVEAFLLEVLSEFAVTIPEIGRVAAEEPPVVIVTSNRTRELHDALKRRCLYHWIDHPALDREIEIIRARAPEVPEALARDVASAVSRLRGFDIAKRPGVAETIDWANAVSFLGAEHLDEEIAAATLGTVLKDHDDQQLAVDRLGEVVDGRERP